MRFVLSAFLIASAVFAADPTGSVSGVVINDFDRQPVRKASVVLTSLSQDRSFAVAITDAAGRFTLPAIPAGRFRLNAVRSGFFSVSYGSTKPRHQGAALNLAPAQQRTGITLHLVPSQFVSGTVYDAEGDPLPGIQVSFYTRQFDRGRPRYQQIVGGATDQRGHYSIPALVPGQFWAMAHGTHVTVFRTRPVAVAGNSMPQETVAPQYFSSAERPENATPIVILPGRDMSNVDFRLNYAPQVSVHGTVSGIPQEARGVSLRLEPESFPTDERFGGSMIRLDPARPTFQMGGLIPGRYKLVAQAGTRRSATQVQLSSADTELNLTLGPGTPLNGSVMVEGPGADQLKNLRISLTPGDNLSFQGPLQANSKLGSFLFPEVPAGVWDINVFPLPRGAYIKSMRLGQKDVLLEDMEIGPGTKAALSIVISTAAPKVEGTLESGGSATVLAAPTGRLAQVFSFYATTQADEKGHFKFEGLNPGAYRFYAFQEVEPEAWQEPAFLASFEAQSKPAELKEGATETLTLPVIGSTDKP